MKPKLEDLKVKSFVTGPDAARGGTGIPFETFQRGCETSPIVCDIVTLQNCQTQICI